MGGVIFCRKFAHPYSATGSDPSGQCFPLLPTILANSLIPKII